MKPEHFWRHAATATLLTLLVVLAVGSTDSNGGSGGNQSPASVTGERIITSDGFIGSIHKEDQDKLIDYAVQKDMEAFRTFLAAGLLTGKCVQFKKGEAVYVMDTALFSGLVKVRRKGETVEYWTNLEAVK